MVNNGNVGKKFGRRCSGIIVNNGVCGEDFSDENSGVVVNNGDVDYASFSYYHSGVLVNRGKIESFLCVTNRDDKTLSCVVVNDGEMREVGLDCFAVRDGKPITWETFSKKTHIIIECEGFSKLKKYADELCDLSKTIKDDESAKSFIERYGPNGERVEPEIRHILSRGPSYLDRIKEEIRYTFGKWGFEI